MPVRSEIAQAQVARFSALGNWRHLTNEAIEELYNVARHDPRDEKHLVAAVNLIIRDEKWVPTPADFLETLRAFQEKPTFQKEACDLCDGSGWKYTWFLVTLLTDKTPDGKQRFTADRLPNGPAGIPVVVGKQEVVESCGFCDCAMGRQRKAAEDAYKAQRDSAEEQARQRLLAKRAGRALSKAEPPADYKAKAAGGDE